MIVNKQTKSYQTRSDMPNSNWMDENWYTIPDDSELYHKVLKLYPHFDFITNEDYEIIDIVEIAKTEEEKTNERIAEIYLELKRIDSEGVTRHLENQIEASGTYDVIYETTRKLIDQKKALREERKTLIQKGEM